MPTSLRIPAFHGKRKTTTNGGFSSPSLSSSSSSPSRSSCIPIRTLLMQSVFGLICFYFGLLVGMSGSSSNNSNAGNGSTTGSNCGPVATTVGAAKNCPPCPKAPLLRAAAVVQDDSTSSCNNITKFPSTLSNMFSDYTAVSRVELNSVLEVGVPLDDTKPGAEDALILYTSPKSQPKHGIPDGSSNAKKLSASEALENCRTVKLILMETSPQHPTTECLAILPQWESYYVHKFMRVPPKGAYGPVDSQHPLRYVSRSHDAKGRLIEVPDYYRHTKPSYDALVEYLHNLDDILKELKPILEQVLQSSSNNNQDSKAIIVQVCNYGQVELFYNFLCNSKAKGLDTSQVLLFATDEKTYQLCQSLGIAAYYNAAIFGDMPEQAAHGYGDRIFTRMMMAKVYCVHLVLSCGYSVLFQDVDLVWYRNPLPYLEHDPTLQEWDLLFQDDGARSHRYAPYSPNTGFYFVRYSAETLFFFGMLLRSGDNVAKTNSHQAALNALLNEHASWKGLRVKVWRMGEGNPFPGGVEYHRKKDMLKALTTKNKEHMEWRKQHPGKALPESNMVSDNWEHPFLFHMSWTRNKDNKKLYFEQMGEWYLRSECPSSTTTIGWDCCLAEPEITCHYRDKPSMIPCKDSPPIDAGRPSFW